MKQNKPLLCKICTSRHIPVTKMFSSAHSTRSRQILMNARRMELTQTIAAEVNMAVTRAALQNSLQTMIDSKLSNFQQNTQQFSNL